MKGINTYISEKLHINKNVKDPYNYHPKTKDELIECIEEKIEKEGFGTEDRPLDLNDIDTSKITDMSNLFDRTDGKLKDLSQDGYFDISDWDVSNVENMQSMFYDSYFYGDISDWDVSNVKNMQNMFMWSKFNGNISDWDVSNVENMERMFTHAARFNCDLNEWNTKNVKSMKGIFYGCPAPIPEWYKTK